MFRPDNLENIVGQEKIKASLEINLSATKKEGQTFPHVLLYGPPGTGKSVFASAIANELGTKLQVSNGANIRSVKKLLPYLMRIDEGDIFFIDEIHSCTNIVANYLLTAIEQYRVDLGEDEKVSLELPQFTFVAATTNPGKLIKPLRDRFLLQYALQEYTEEELILILQNNIDKLNVGFTGGAVKAIVRSSRSTPRIANNRLYLINNFAISKDLTTIQESHVLECLKMEDVTEDGMTVNDRKYLNVLRRIQPASLNTLVSALNLSKDEIEEIVEPFLISRGLITKTTKGRELC